MLSKNLYAFNNLLKTATILFCVMLWLSGCEKNNDLTPRSFTVVVEDIYISSMVVRWTESTDPENSIVKYRVYIAEDVEGAEFELVADNISENQFSQKREFLFFQNISDLKNNTRYRGKVVAFDQDGDETEIGFSAKTVKGDNTATASIRPYQKSAEVTVEVDYTGYMGANRKLTADIYVNDILVKENIEATVENVNEEVRFVEIIDNLEKNTEYDLRIVLESSNNRIEKELTFSTAGDTFEGDVTFRYQEEVDEFAKNQFLSVKGNITCYLPSGCHPEDPYKICGYNITDLSILNSITKVEGNIYLGTFDNPVTGTGSPVNGFAGLQTITGDLELFQADLTDLFGVINNVGGNLSIKESSRFTSLNIFTDLDFIGGDIEITLNRDLVDFCSLQTLLTNGHSGSYEVNGNGYNPTVDAIVNGNCSQ